MQLQGRITIGRLVAILHRMANIYLSNELKTFNIGAGQYIFLAELFDQEGQSQDELTKRVCVDKANSARALGKLEEAGYVRRVGDAKDKRVKRAYLEPAAREIEEDFWRVITHWSDILTRNLSKQRQERLIKDLETMLESASGHLSKIQDL